MWEQVGLALLLVGGMAFVFRCIRFVQVTLPEHFGSNPGFGALEVMTMPWLITGCVGFGLWLESWKWAVALFIAGLFTTGMLAMLLAHLFGRRG